MKSGRLHPPDWLSNDYSVEEKERIAGEKSLDEYIIEAHIKWYLSGQCRDSDTDLIILAGFPLRYWLHEANVKLQGE